MNIFNLRQLLLTITFMLSTQVLATESESNSNWFAGTSLNISTFNDDDNIKSSNVAADLRGGYQFGKFLKLMVGAGSSDSFSSLFVAVRPQWEFDSGFSLQYYYHF